MPRTSNLLPNSPKEWRLQAALAPFFLGGSIYYGGQGGEAEWPVACAAWVSGLYLCFHAGVAYSRRLRDLGKDSGLPWLRDLAPSELDPSSPNPPYRWWWAVAVAGILGTPFWVYNGATQRYVQAVVLVTAIAGALFTAGVLYERRLVEFGKEARFGSFRDNRRKV